MKKIEKIVMACFALLPFAFILLFFIARIGQGTTQFDTMETAWQQISTWSNQIEARNISQTIYNIIGNFGMYIYSGSTRTLISNILSYEILLLFIHICYEVLAFLPKFCITAWEKFERRTDK